MERWSGKVALVTGASAGIGAAIAEQLVSNGLQVIGLAEKVERIVELKQKLAGAKGKLIPLKADISKLEEIDEAFKFIQENFGTIHILVNNAGIGRDGLISTGSMEDFQMVIDINFRGLVACNQKALQLMKVSGVDDGHIININSLSGQRVMNFPLPIFNVYPATKCAVTSFTESLRKELAFLKSKIRITSVSPGTVSTDFGQSSMANSKTSTKHLWTKDVFQMMMTAPKIEANDVADMVIFALQCPPHVNVSELIVQPVGESY